MLRKDAERLATTQAERTLEAQINAARTAAGAALTVPGGGTLGQVLAKNSATTGDYSWQSSGGGGNSVAVAMNFGAAFTDKAQTVVTGQSWVAVGSEIVGQILTPSGTDPDEMRLLDMRVVISDIVAGDGFTVTIYSETEAKGSYTVACIGV